MKVTIVYINADAEFVKELELDSSASVEDAIEASEVLDIHKEISLDYNQVGIFNQAVDLKTRLKPDDRVEIYRLLTVDPMQSRRQKANNLKKS